MPLRMPIPVEGFKHFEFDDPPIERHEVYVEIFEQAENFKKYNN